ncbi:MAG: hypothetical protein K2Y32_09450 [Candidatus Obscuribacterales bacterium]|nr:hypothetical protein [Candidatus Obscuribacterales bacterium]
MIESIAGIFAALSLPFFLLSMLALLSGSKVDGLSMAVDLIRELVNCLFDLLGKLLEFLIELSPVIFKLIADVFRVTLTVLRKFVKM